MPYITSTAKLKEAIQQLEFERVNKEQLLIKDFQQAYTFIKPVSFFRSTLNDVFSSPLLIENIIGTAISLASGYVTKKIIIGRSDSKIRKLIGSVVEFGVINMIARRHVVIELFGRFLLNLFFKKDINSKNRD